MHTHVFWEGELNVKTKVNTRHVKVEVLGGCCDSQDGN